MTSRAVVTDSPTLRAVTFDSLPVLELESETETECNMI